MPAEKLCSRLVVCRKEEDTMGKIKTHSASAKRFSLTASGKVKINHTNRRHKLGLKSTKRKRDLRKTGYLSPAFTKNVTAMIPKH